MSEADVDMTRGLYRFLYAGLTRCRKVNSVTIFAELLLWRIHVVSDDFGNFEADAHLVLCNAFPRRRDLSERQVLVALDELVKADLITLHTINGDTFGHIVEFEEAQPARRNGRKIRRYPAQPTLATSIPTTVGNNPSDSMSSTKSGIVEKTKVSLQPTAVEEPNRLARGNDSERSGRVTDEPKTVSAHPRESGCIQGDPGETGCIQGSPGESGCIRGSPGESGCIRGSPGESGCSDTDTDSDSDSDTDTENHTETPHPGFSQGSSEGHSDETSNAQAPPPRSSASRRAAEVELPPGPQSAAFKAAWSEWQVYRRELKKPLTPSTARRQLEDLELLSEERAVATINQSIKAGWTGLFPEPKHATAKNPNRSNKALREFSEDLHL